MENIIKDRQFWIDGVWDKIENKLVKTSRRINDCIIYTTDKSGKYVEMDDIYWWTNGFWAGILWLMHNKTGDEFYKAMAENIENKLDEALQGYDDLHHDVGFMWLLTSVANYRITGSDKSRRRGLIAASVLASRFQIDGGFIRAWNKDMKGWAIIDCMMNIPLLYWASEQAGDERFKKIAEAHANKVMDVFVRPDGSVNHIVSINPDTGEVIECLAGQGYDSNSSWSRGQAWAIYGFVLSYIYTKNMDYLNTAKRVAHYFLADLSMKDDFVPDCDFRQPQGRIIKDSSAGAIAACGLIEISKYVGENEKDLYLNGAFKILDALDKECGAWDESSEAILKKGAALYHNDSLHNMALIYGDYYFVEAILKLKDNDILLW